MEGWNYLSVCISLNEAATAIYAFEAPLVSFDKDFGHYCSFSLNAMLKLLSVPAFAGFALFFVLLYKYLLFPAFLSPLAKIPNAHFTSCISPAWILWKRYRRLEVRTIHAAHQRLGSIVRLAPNELSVNCVDGGIRTIYSGGFDKPEWYKNLFSNYGYTHIYPIRKENAET